MYGIVIVLMFVVTMVCALISLPFWILGQILQPKRRRRRRRRW